MENQLFEDLKAIYYALDVIYGTKQADKILNRLVKKLKKAKITIC